MEWLSVPEFAERIRSTPSQVRDKLRDGALLAMRRGENNAWYLPAEFIVMGDHAEHIIPTLKGTITLLHDMALTDDEALHWLLTTHDELGAPPLQVLREGQRAAVRRAAQTLL